MEVIDLVEQVELDGKVTYCVFKGDELIEIPFEQAKYRKIRYIYAEGDELFIEVEEEE